jgi:hypothetical protein
MPQFSSRSCMDPICRVSNSRAKAASNQHGGVRAVPFATERIAVRTRQKALALLGSEPVLDTDSNPAHSLKPPDPGRKFGTE